MSPSKDRLRFVHLVLPNLGRLSVPDVLLVTYVVQATTRTHAPLDSTFKLPEMKLEQSLGKVSHMISF